MTRAPLRRAALLLLPALLPAATAGHAEPYTGVAPADHLLTTVIAWLLVLGAALPVAVALAVATGAPPSFRPRFWLAAAGFTLLLALAAALLHIPAILQELVLMILRLLF